MSDQSRNAILLMILEEIKDQQITVTGVRDVILERNPQEVMRPADLRRWVNGQFVTLVRKGVMAKHPKTDSRRSFFTITGNIEKNAAKPKSHNESPPTPKAPKGSQSSSLHTLRDELEGHRLRALTELSEIDEYKRIIKQFPDLSAKTKVKFNTAIEENCKTLGRIKALEEILEYKAMNP
ncbi:hypothetical protein WKI13_04430 [Teredinibacter turnerae]|uniref:hypothetical protein n=1 Tax=Teredinibacter turnerae TaxID=2426 RepID=UPI000686CC12|nr:hypothetical protein [Teredinibacter turnerae]